ncbi:MAG: hypothetical protein L3K16_08055 [Thermoplasmata archaeon]|nr:hypothetical protein [Thermoplasmata archaeon]
MSELSAESTPRPRDPPPPPPHRAPIGSAPCGDEEGGARACEWCGASE